MTDDRLQQIEELEGQLAALKRELTGVEPEPEPPRDPERAFAERMLERINASRTPWLDVGGGDAT